MTRTWPEPSANSTPPPGPCRSCGRRLCQVLAAEERRPESRDYLIWRCVGCGHEVLRLRSLAEIARQEA